MRPYPRQLGQHVVLSLPRDTDDRAGHPYLALADAAPTQR
jgi:hypothetical protein